eukprot:Nk52_evm17s219 gene=Nk52_evmTU17s219
MSLIIFLTAILCAQSNSLLVWAAPLDSVSSTFLESGPPVHYFEKGASSPDVCFQKHGTNFSQCSVEQILVLPAFTIDLPARCEYGSLVNKFTGCLTKREFQTVNNVTKSLPLIRIGSSQTQSVGVHCCHRIELNSPLQMATDEVSFQDAISQCNSKTNTQGHKMELCSQADINYAGFGSIETFGSIDFWLSSDLSFNFGASLNGLFCRSNAKRFAMCCPRGEQANIKAPISYDIPYFDRNSKKLTEELDYKWSFKMKGGEDDPPWTPLEGLYGFSFFANTDWFLMDLNSDLSKIPNPYSSTIFSLAGGDVKVSILDSTYTKETANTNGFALKCVSESQALRLCTTYNVTLFSGTTVQFDSAALPASDLKPYLNLKTTKSPKYDVVPMTLSNGAYMAFMRTTKEDGKKYKEFRLVRVLNNTKFIWESAPTSVSDTGCMNGYSMIFRQDIDKDADALLLTTQGFGSINESFNYNQMSCALMDSFRDMVCTCQDEWCKYKVIEIAAIPDGSFLLPHAYDISDFGNDRWEAYNNIEDSPFAIDVLMFAHLFRSKPDAEYYPGTVFMNKLLQTYSASKSSTVMTATALLEYAIQWESLLPQGKAYNNARSTLAKMRKLVQSGTNLAVHNGVMEVTGSTEVAISSFTHVYTAMQSVYDGIDRINWAEVNLDNFKTLAKGMETQQQTFSQYSKYQSDLLEKKITGVNQTITALVHKVGDTTARYEKAAQKTIDDIKKKMLIRTVMNLFEGVIGIVSGFGGSLEGVQNAFATFKAQSGVSWFERAKSAATTLKMYKDDFKSATSDGVAKFKFQPSVNDDMSCPAKISDALAKTSVSMFYLDFFSQQRPVTKVISDPHLSSAWSSLSMASTDLSVQMTDCLSPQVKNLERLCAEYRVDCKDVILESNTLVTLGKGLAKSFDEFNNDVYKRLSLELTTAMYETSVEDWNNVVKKYDPKTVIYPARSLSYDSLNQGMILSSSYLLSWCCSFAYRYGLTYSQVSSVCGKLPKFINSGMNGVSDFMDISKKNQDLYNTYGARMAGINFRVKSDISDFIGIGALLEFGEYGRNSSNPAGFDVEMLKNSFENVGTHGIYTASLYIPLDYKWIYKNFQLYDPLLSAKLAALKIVFEGVSTKCQTVEGFIREGDIMKYYPQNAPRRLVKATIPKRGYSGSATVFSYEASDPTQFHTIANMCSTADSTGACGSSSFTLPKYTTLPLLSGVYEIGIKAIPGCDLNVNNVTGLKMDYQAFYFGTLSEKQQQKLTLD